MYPKSPSSFTSSDDDEKKAGDVHIEAVKRRPPVSRMQSLRDGMKRALTATSILTFGTTSGDESALRPTISNPLAGVPQRKLNQRVLDLADEFDLMEDLDMLKKGARLAQKAKDWRSIADELTADEVKLLERVEARPWTQATWPLALTVAAASFGALTLGWDQGVVSGATLHYPAAMGIDPNAAAATAAAAATTTTPSRIAFNNWITGLVSAGPFLGAACLSVWLSDTVNHHLGRRGCLFVAAAFLLASPLGSAFTATWPQLFVCRVLLGVGVGFLEVTAPVFAAESAPAEIRGAMTINFQLFTALGILLGCSTNLVFEGVANDWRFMLAAPMLPVPALVALLWASPESARWYLKWGRVREAYCSLRRLRRSDLLAARDLYLIHAQMAAEDAAIGGARNVHRFAELFYRNRVRQSTLASCVVHLAQVLSGVNIVCLFSGTILAELTGNPGGGGRGGGLSTNERALLGSWGFGAVNFAFTLPAIWSIDRLGRRALMLYTLPNLCWTLLGAGLCFLIGGSNKAAELGLVLAFVYVYTALYSVGMGPIPFCYSAESAAQTHRELSVALAAFVNNAANAVLSITFFRMRQALTTTGVFGFYSGATLCMTLLVFALVPETKQLSLEELDAVFAHSNREFVAYQFTHALPHFWRRLLHGRSEPPLPPLAEARRIDRLDA